MLEMMDLVYLMVDGRAVESGTHRELIANSALYRQTVLREDS
jgi:ABC-type multidrug transport system fused ATPase/permease subunit